MPKITETQRNAAKIAAINAQEALVIGDNDGYNKAIKDLFVAVGYWVRRRTLSPQEFRGEIVPPKKLRMPQGRSVYWADIDKAIKAWAST